MGTSTRKKKPGRKSLGGSELPDVPDELEQQAVTRYKTSNELTLSTTVPISVNKQQPSYFVNGYEAFLSPHTFDELKLRLGGMVVVTIEMPLSMRMNNLTLNEAERSDAASTSTCYVPVKCWLNDDIIDYCIVLDPRLVTLYDMEHGAPLRCTPIASSSTYKARRMSLLPANDAASAAATSSPDVLLSLIRQSLCMLYISDRLISRIVRHSVCVGNVFALETAGTRFSFVISEIEMNNGSDSVTVSMDTVNEPQTPGSPSPSPSSTSTVRVGVVREDTTVRIIKKRKTTVKTSSIPSSSIKIGGLSNQISSVMESINAALYKSEVFRQMGMYPLSKSLYLGLPPPKGVLLYGPPGTGKTLLARYIASVMKTSFYVIQAPDLASKFVGESEERLKETFQEASNNKPSIIFIDEVEVIGTKRDDAMHSSDLSKRTLGTLLVLLDGLYAMDGVFVIAATNQPGMLDPALRRPGRFDRELEVGVPSADSRREILQVLLTNVNHSLTNDDIIEVAKSCHGHVGADLASLIRESAMLAMKQSRSTLTIDDLRAGLHHVRPSAMRELLIDVPHVRWDDIGGQREMKARIQEAVLWPLQKPEMFKRFGISPPKGILLYGPPGCAKTLVAKAVATECGLNFISVKGPELFNMWVGESEKAVREVFRKARVNAPSIIFFDEIDAIAVARGSSGSEGSSVGDRVLSAMLTEMDGVEGLRDVVIIAATNRPDIMDAALLRPGRFDRLLYVPLPDNEGRVEIFKICLRDVPLADDVNIQLCADNTEGYSGAELKSVCQEAAMVALRENNSAARLEQRHLNAAISIITKRTPETMIQFFDKFSLNRK